jgi:hypothetical protein
VKRALVVVALAAAGGASGCFYEAQLDERPSVAIVDQPTTTVYRGNVVTLQATASSPTGNAVTVQWAIYACTNASDQATDCDATPFDSDTTNTTSFTVPLTRADGLTPTLAVRVLLDAEDDLGATAQPTQELIIPIGDHPPVLVLAQASAHDDAVGSHVILDAQVSDPDDVPSLVALSWSVVTPSPNANYTLSAATVVGSDATTVTYASELDAQVTGGWTVAVTATDPEGATTTQSFAVTINNDLPPCIASPSPVADPTQVYPLVDATLFEVPIVTDDLDVYPPSQSGDPDFGVATFHWSIEEPGGSAFAPLDVTGNGVPLDPSTYNSGDVIQLRVEAHDRVDRSAGFTACGDAATCTLDLSRPTCLQRITWTVEVP